MVAAAFLTDASVGEGGANPHPVALLIQSSRLAVYWPDLFAAAARQLRSAPAFGPNRAFNPGRTLAFRRLRNAETYVRAEHFAAARIELRLLAAQLDTWPPETVGA